MRNRLTATVAFGFAVAATPAFATGPANPYASPVTAPNGVLWLPDTLTAAKGHWWFTDHLLGLCRLDPVSGSSTALINASTCVPPALGGQAGQPAFDPARNLVYLPDLSRKSQGVTRFSYNRATGTINTFQNKRIIPVVPAGASDVAPDAAALDSRGNLFVAFKRGSDIVRIKTPNATPGAPQAIAQSGGRSVRGIAFDQADDLFLANNTTVEVIPDPAAAANGCTKASPCLATDAGFGVPVINAQTVAFDGANLHVGTLAGVVRVTDPGCVQFPDCSGTSVASLASLTTVMAVGARQPAPAVGTTPADPGAVLAGSDPSAGLTPLQGTLYQMTPY